MVCAQVVGNDATIALAGMSGVFELNVMMPVIAYDLLQSIEILAAAARLLAERCIDGIEPRRERAAELVEMSFALVTSLAPRIGYDAAAAIAKEAAATGRTVREVARGKNVLPADELDRVLDPRAMTEGGIVGGD
jgi:fumarate hydratase class II